MATNIYVGVNHVVGIVDQPTVFSTTPTGEDAEVNFLMANVTTRGEAIRGLDNLAERLAYYPYPYVAGTDQYYGVSRPFSSFDNTPTFASAPQGTDIELHIVTAKFLGRNGIAQALEKIKLSVMNMPWAPLP